jgi:hypothetical protein
MAFAALVHIARLLQPRHCDEAAGQRGNLDDRADSFVTALIAKTRVDII